MSVVYLNNVIQIRRTLKNIGVFAIYRERKMAKQKYKRKLSTGIICRYYWYIGHTNNIIYKE